MFCSKETDLLSIKLSNILKLGFKMVLVLKVTKSVVKGQNWSFSSLFEFEEPTPDFPVETSILTSIVVLL